MDISVTRQPHSLIVHGAERHALQKFLRDRYIEICFANDLSVAQFIYIANTMYFAQKLLLILVFFGASLSLYSQERDSIGVADPTSEQIRQLEDYIQERSLDDDFDFNTLFESLEYYANKPLNLNKASREELIELGLLTEIQINALENYKIKQGDLLALYELQSIPFFDIESIKRLLPYVTLNKGLDDYQVSILKMVSKGKNELYLRGSRVLENQLGFINEKADDANNFYFGGPYKIYTRYKHSYENKLSYGITAENDAGESFLSGSNPNGFDFYSFHFALKNYNSKIKDLVIGDFTASFGQGLIMHSGFGAGKSSETIDLKKNRRVLKAYTSVDENLFNRGIGITLGINKKIDFTIFGSSLKRDANIIIPDSLDTQEERLFSSLQATGLHRTNAEILDEDAIELQTVGANLKFKLNSLTIGMNALFNSFNSRFERNLVPFNQFTFNQDRLLNGSIDYAYIFKNYHFFGETAVSDNGALASLNSLIIGLDRHVFLAISHRDYARNYQALLPNAFGETGNVNNEKGLYLGLQIKPNYNWKFTAFYDIWKHPWLRFGIDAPSIGNEYLFKALYKRKRKFEIYVQYRREQRQFNEVGNETKTNFLVSRTKQNLRFHVSNKISESLELRNRLDLTYFKAGNTNSSTGFLIYQDFIFKPKSFPLSFTGRIAYFDIDSFDARAFAFENDLLYSFSIPSYFNQGTRYYLNLRYKGFKNLTLEARIAQTHWANSDTIGSQLNEINGQNQTEVKAQVKFVF